MQRYNGIYRLGALLLLVCWALALRVNAQQPWQLVQMDKGGVAEDVQLVYHDQPTDAQNQVWTACMNGGFYRSTWSSGAWSDWAQYLPAKKAFGVDAIELTRNQVDYEFVLCASQGLGVWYGSSPQTSFDPEWDRPNPDYYPESWWQAGTHDVAFHWPPSGMPGNHPEQQYYVLLTYAIESNDPGVYEWNNTFHRFDRVPNQPTGAHQYRHFYRDLAAPNVLYVLSETGLYRISGGYGEEDFDNVTPTVADSVFGFNQWKDENEDVTYYILAQKTIGDAYAVFSCEDLATDPEYTDTYDIPEDLDLNLNRDWEELFRYSCGAGVIGRPIPNTEDHRLWLTAPEYGVWYIETTGNPEPVQINGPQSNPTLKRWAVRAFTPDPGHVTGNEKMRLFFGTHQAGVWYLEFSDLNLSLDN